MGGWATTVVVVVAGEARGRLDFDDEAETEPSSAAVLCVVVAAVVVLATDGGCCCCLTIGLDAQNVELADLFGGVGVVDCRG